MINPAHVRTALDRFQETICSEPSLQPSSIEAVVEWLEYCFQDIETSEDLGPSSVLGDKLFGDVLGNSTEFFLIYCDVFEEES